MAEEKRVWDKERYKQELIERLQRNINFSNWRQVAISEAFERYYNNNYQNDDYLNLLTLHETTAVAKSNTPFVKVFADSINPKLHLMLGDLKTRGFELSIRAKDLAAAKRRKRWKAQAEFQMSMQEFYQKAAQFTGIPYGINENIPQNEEELDEYMDRFRDVYERIMLLAMNDLSDNEMYKKDRINYFLNLLLTNEVHAMPEIVNRKVSFRRLNPFNVIPDHASENDFKDDATSFLYAYYLGIPEAIDRYDNLTAASVKKMIKRYQNQSMSGWSGTSYITNNRSYRLFSPFYSSSEDQNYDRILVVEGIWKDISDEAQTVVYKDDEEQVYNYLNAKDARLTSTQRKDPRNSIERAGIQVVRKATLLGGQHVVDFGIASNNIRNSGDEYGVELNAVSVVSMYNGRQSKPFASRLYALNDLKDYYLTILQKEITTNIGDVLYVDKNNLDVATYGTGEKALSLLLHTAKAYKVVIGDGSKRQYAPGSTDKPFSRVPAQRNQFLVDLLNMVMYLDDQINMVSGMNPGRTGDLGERSLASTSQLQVNQSRLMTEIYYDRFEGFENKLFGKAAKLQAMIFDNEPQIVAEYASRLGIEEEDVPDDFSFQTFESKVQAQPLSRQELLVAVNSSVAANALSWPDALLIFTSIQKDGMTEAINKFIKLWDRRQEKMMQQQQQMQQEQMQQQQQSQEFDAMAKLREIQEMNMGKIKAAEINRDGTRQLGLLGLQQDDRKLQASRANMKEQAEMADRN